MADEKAQRIRDALSNLVDRLIPPDQAEDDAEADAIHDNAFDFAQRILESNIEAPVVADATYAADLIKRRLLLDQSSPDKASRFSNLYSRLLAQPVLSRKWGIIYLLQRLSDADTSGEDGESNAHLGQGRMDTPTLSVAGSIRPSSDIVRQVDPGGSVFEDAFSTSGLQNLPPKSGSRTPRGIRSDAGEVFRSGRERGVNGVETGVDSARRAATPNVDGVGQDTHSRPGQARRGDQEKRLDDSNIAEEPSPPNPAAPVSETSLLRDLPFTLQGLSSTHFSFVSPSVLALPTTLPAPLIALLYTLAEPSLLYRSISDSIQSPDGGLIAQSLKAAIGLELRSYLGLVATLEGEIRRALTAIGTGESRERVGKAGVTLKRCVVWTREATMGLRLMSVMVEDSKNKKGGQLISMVHGFSTSQGDPFVVAFAERLLSSVTLPFYEMLRLWVYDGELSDPYHEFFITEQNIPTGPDVNGLPRRVVATSVWQEKYHLDDDMIPSILTEAFAKKVFLIGKSLNFIRYGCGDSAWVEAYSKNSSRELRYGDTATLERSIDEAYRTTMARLIHLMDHKFHLFDHLVALKKYILLGQGDFIALLMESLASNLDRPASSQYRHNLTAQLEHAVRGSNAQYDSPDTLRRLDARLLELSHGDIGWDLFTLDYKIEAPVDVVVTPWATSQYLKVFNFLWRIKRVEFALGSTWRRCMTGSRGVLSAVEHEHEHDKLNLGDDWKAARCCIAEMIHFVCQLQYYILFEVIEASWDELQLAIHKPDCTLDGLIEAHTNYLNSITRKGLLGAYVAGGTGGAKNEDDISYLHQLHRILKLMLHYKDAVDGLYSVSVAEFTKGQEAKAKIETRTAMAKRGRPELDDDPDAPTPNASLGATARDRRRRNRLRDIPPRTDSPFQPAPLAAAAAGLRLGGEAAEDEDQILAALRKRLRDLGVDFRTRVGYLLGDLANQSDTDMRFLGVMMNFNDVYRLNRRDKLAAKRGKALGRSTPKPGVTPSTSSAGDAGGPEKEDEGDAVSETGTVLVSAAAAGKKGKEGGRIERKK